MMNKQHFNILVAITCIALLLFSCTAEKHLAKAIKKDKPYVAEQTRLLFPCIVTASDTVNTVDTLYDLIEAQCPDVEYITPEGKTIYLPGKTTTIQGPTIYRDRIIKEKVEDSAQVYLALNNLEVAQAAHAEEVGKLKAEIVTKQKKIVTKNKVIKWETGLLIACLLWIFGPFILRIIRRIIKPV